MAQPFDILQGKYSRWIVLAVHTENIVNSDEPIIWVAKLSESGQCYVDSGDDFTV